MGIKRLVYDSLSVGRGNLGYKKKRSSSMVSGSGDGAGSDQSDILERRVGDIIVFRSGDWWNFFNVIQADKRGAGIWRQLDDTHFGDVSGNMEIASRAWNCIFKCNGDRRDRNGWKEIEKKEQDSLFAIFGNWLSGGIWLVKTGCKASTIVEMAYLMPVVLLTWMLIIFALFYYHDKTILVGAAYESAVVGSEWYSSEDEVEEERINNYFQNRIRRKLLFFSSVPAEVKIEDEQIVIKAEARKRGMRVQAIQKAAILCPEKEVRKIRRIKMGLEEATE